MGKTNFRTKSQQFWGSGSKAATKMVPLRFVGIPKTPIVFGPQLDPPRGTLEPGFSEGSPGWVVHRPSWKTRCGQRTPSGPGNTSPPPPVQAGGLAIHPGLSPLADPWSNTKQRCRGLGTLSAGRPSAWRWLKWMRWAGPFGSLGSVPGSWFVCWNVCVC